MPISTKKNVLVVEDNIESQLIFKIYLRELYNVEIAENGSKGLEFIKNNNYDLVVLDINLPGNLDGIGLIKEVRDTLEIKNLPILVVSAYALKGDKEDLINKGANDFLSKPVGKELLLDKVNNLI